VTVPVQKTVKVAVAAPGCAPCGSYAAAGCGCCDAGYRRGLFRR
jgi:hypothetical protein